ncbi:28S ribosomal protein S18b, mitochondrial-like, partial [Neopelma chrysocephalum]|uniref:28S ribosomal protein S18b, mitochondrial-like n=1 Tax=Neopelma chrysocephalum TaxID=114329 RepID=UPI000FCD0ED7
MALGRAAAALRAAAAAAAALRPAGTPLWARDHPRLCSSQEAPKSSEEPKGPKEPPSRYLERPWEYLESEEYRVTYGDRPVWFGYKRNHKGAIPPQRTRKACLVRLGALGGTGGTAGGVGG